MIVTYVAPATALLGLLVYVLSANPKSAEVGRLLLFAGCLATLLMINGAHPIRLP